MFLQVLALCALLLGVFLYFVRHGAEIQREVVRAARAQEEADYVRENKQGIMVALCREQVFISDREPELNPALWPRYYVPMRELAFLEGYGKMSRLFAHQCIREFCCARLFLLRQHLEKEAIIPIVLWLAHIMLPRLYVK